MYMDFDNNDIRGFSLPELLAVLIILVLIALLAINVIKGTLMKTDDVIDKDTEKQIINGAEKWAIENSSKFDDVDGTVLTTALDVVFVVDATRDMKNEFMSFGEGKIRKGEGVVNAINASIDMLKKNKENRVSFVFFAKNVQFQTELLHIENFVKDNSKRLKFVKDDSTYMYQILEEPVVIGNNLNYTLPAVQTAIKILQDYSSDTVKRIPVIIHVTEGETLYGYTGDATIGNDYLEPKVSDYGISATTWCWSTETMNQLQELLAKQGSAYKKHIKGTAEDQCESFGKAYKGASVTNSTYDGYCPVDWILNDWNKNKDKFSSENTSKIILNIMQTYARAKKEISKIYDASMYIYTVGIGADREYGKFMLNSGESGLEGLKNAGKALEGLDQKTYAYFDTLWHVDVGLALYDIVKEMPKESYDYVTKAFINPESSEALTDALRTIATQLNEKTMVSEVCVKVKDLQKDGYLKNNVKLPEGLSADTSVLISFNEPTHQFSYSIATTTDQVKSCNKYYQNQLAK